LTEMRQQHGIFSSSLVMLEVEFMVHIERTNRSPQLIPFLSAVL
jgi:hypothetical protein